jgi:extracellular elastinolytic metalloproteinase
VSNRLTGGPANAGCLSSLESGGMGEGWSDFMATAIRLKRTDTRATDYTMCSWVSNNANGIRAVKYSTSLTTNPYTYTTVNSQTAVHTIGTTWASILYEVLWNLIDKHGKNDGTWPQFNSAGIPTDGKFLAMKLVIDGMALQPCNPTFVSARDAIIDADRALTGGANSCALWTAFAKRGLGSGASYNGGRRIASTTIPSGAC